MDASERLAYGGNELSQLKTTGLKVDGLSSM
jgi:hypothetical protein